MNSSSPSPQTTLMIVLGASEWPHDDNFRGSAAFAKAAEKLKGYFLHSFDLPEKNVLWLFNTQLNTRDIDKEICNHIEKFENIARDVIVYYVGHGQPTEDRSGLYLAIYDTQNHNPESSSLRLKDLARTLKVKARNLRRFYILDCCFAAAALVDLQAANVIDNLIHTTFEEVEIVERGFAALCSSGKSESSVILPDHENTFFTEALLHVLSEGNSQLEEYLSLKNVCDLIEDTLTVSYRKYLSLYPKTDKPPKPQIYLGNIANIPLFPNPGKGEKNQQIKPGGTWIRPEHGEKVKDFLHFAASAYPTHPADPPIDHVNFTIGWHSYWQVACVAYAPASGSLYRGEVDMRQLDLPLDTLDNIQVSFDVFDQEGHINSAPHGVRTIAILKTTKPSDPVAEVPPSPQEPGALLHRYDDHASWVLAVAWEPGGTRIASAGGDGTVRVWESETGKALVTYHGHTRLLNMINHPATVYTVAWSPDGLRIASAGDGTHVHVWNAATGQKLTLYQEHSGLWSNVFAVAWSPDGKQIASVCTGPGFDKTVHIWDAATGQTLTRYDASYGWMPTFSVLSLAWSPDGAHIAAACGDKAIRVWDTATEHLVSIYRFRSEGSSHIAWSPDSRYLASAHPDHTVQIWDRLTGKSVMIYHGHTDAVRYVAWSPDGVVVATAANDRTVHIWEALAGKHLYTYRGHSDWVTSVSWFFDGTRIASASNDKTVQVWRVG